MKKLLAIVLVVAMTAAMTACGSKTSTEKDKGEVTKAPAKQNTQVDSESTGSSLSGTITVLSFTEYHDAVQASIDAFMKANPDVTIKMEEYPYAQYKDAVEIKLGSQSHDFDVIMTDTTMVSSWAYQGWLADVDEYFNEEEKNNFVDALVNAGTYDGKFFSPPLCNSAQVLWYNKDLLDMAGVEYPSENPAERLTWEEIVEISQKVMNASGDSSVYGLTFEQVDRPYQILPIANSAGADAFGEDGLTVDGYLNSDKFIKAMQFYSDIHNKYNISPKGTSASETTGLFTAGKVAFLCANIFNYKTFSDVEGFNFGYTAFPYFEDGIVATPTGSWHVSLSNYSEKKDLAMQFIKYFTLEEGNDIFLKVKGAFAARKDVLQAYETNDEYSAFPLSVFRLASYEALNTAYPRPVTLGYGEFETIIGSTFSDIRNGADVTEALNSAVQQLNTQLSMYK